MLHFSSILGFRTYLLLERIGQMRQRILRSKEFRRPGLFEPGGGFPVRNSFLLITITNTLTEEIIAQIKSICTSRNVKRTDIFTEFGSFHCWGKRCKHIPGFGRKNKTTGRERWYMIDSLFMTTSPTLGNQATFYIVPSTNGTEPYQRVFPGRTYL